MLLFCGLLLWRGVFTWASMPWIGVLVLITSLAAVFRPGWFRGFYRAGMIASAWLGERMGRIFLTGFFFLLVVPLGWILRRVGYDPLALRPRPGAATYWRPVRGKRDLEKMY